MYPITNEVKALFESEQRKVLRITGGVKTPIPNSVGPAAIASFDNAVAADALNVTVDITPVQSGSGDPSPTNVRPISGWTGANVTRTGKNLWNGKYITSLFVESDTWDASQYCYAGNSAMPVIPGKQYTCSLNGVPAYIRYCFIDSNKNDIGSLTNGSTTTVAPSNAVYLKWRLYDIQMEEPVKCQLELGTSATPWEPYTGTTIPISWQSEAGTVYGGTLDVTTGLLTVDRGMVDLGTLNWTYNTNPVNYFSTPITGRKEGFTNLICSHYPTNGSLSISQQPDKTIRGNGGSGTVYVKDSSYTDATTFKSVMSGVQLVYELATPQTYQITPTQIALLAGTNNVWADCGDTSVEYATGYDYEIDISDDNVMEDSFQIDRYSCNGEKLEVGTAIAAQMSFTLENGDGTYDGIVFEDAELLAEVGVADWTQENPTIYWVPCGYFTPDMQPRRLSTISITALDRMAKFDVVVDATDLTFPATIAGLVGQVCTVCGVTLAQSIATLTNADVTVATLPSANGGMTTYRNLIQWCAGIMGTNAWFDWNGLLRFSWYNNATNYVSTRDNRYSSDLYENDLTVTGVEYTNDSGIVIVEGMDDYAIDLTGNAIAGPLIATVLPPLNTALNGFTYRPFTAAAINAPYLWPMDIVTFTDKGGSNHSGALTNVVFGLNGMTALESKGMTYAINKAAQPKGFTREQAQLVNQVVAKNVESHIDDYLTQQEIFNRLTDNGAAQGLVLYNGQLYINASYINAGVLNVGLINFRDYSPPYQAPNEYDPDSLFSGQAIQNGWIVNRDGSSDIGIIGCSDAVPLRGKTLIITLTSRNHITALGGTYDYIGEDGQIWSETMPETEPPAYGREDAEGNLDGATDNGEYEQYSTKYYVRENEVGFYLTVRCSGVKSISVSESYSNNFGLRYGNNIGLNYKGLQVGKFVVDRSGNVTFNGAAIFNGDVALKNPLPLAQGGTGGNDAATARTNLDVYSKSEVNNAIQQTTAVEFINPYSGVRVYKSGNVAEISVEGFSAQQAYSAKEVLFTLPEGYRPRYSVSFLDTLNSGKRIIVESTGKVYVMSALSSGNLLRGCVVYIC